MAALNIFTAGADPITVEAKAIIGSLAIHRPVYRYMPHLPVTVGEKGWCVTHVATGRSLTSHAPNGTYCGKVSLKRLKAWVEEVQSRDREAWASLDAMGFGEGRANPSLGMRIRAAISGGK